jgi:hypothetical protein
MDYRARRPGHLRVLSAKAHHRGGAAPALPGLGGPAGAISARLRSALVFLLCFRLDAAFGSFVIPRRDRVDGPILERPMNCDCWRNSLRNFDADRGHELRASVLECGSPLPLSYAPWPLKSASRRRAEAALWRAAKAEGLAQSKTSWRGGQFVESVRALAYCRGHPQDERTVAEPFSARAPKTAREGACAPQARR